MNKLSQIVRFLQVAATAKGLVVALARPKRILAAIATATFPAALLFPFFTLQPSLGDPLVDAIYDWIDPGSLEPKTYSVIGGIARLFTDGDTGVAVILLLFSVLFPAVKLTLLWGLLIRPGEASPRLVRLLKGLGPWSMADVFVVSVLLVTFKSFPGGTTFAIKEGYYYFLTSVIAGLIATGIPDFRLVGPSSTMKREDSERSSRGARGIH